MTKTEIEALLLETALGAAQSDFKTLDAVRRKMGREEDRMAAAGFSIALLARFPDETKLARDVEKLRAAIVPVPPPDDDLWIDFELGQLGATGDFEYLWRIVRFARHRDGSTNSIVAGGHAVAVLEMADASDPAYHALFASYSFKPSDPTIGHVPADLLSFNRLTMAAWVEESSVSATPSAPVVVPAPVNAPVPPQLAPSNSAGMPAAGGQLIGPLVGSVNANTSTGSIDSIAGAISVTDALSLVQALTYATRRLLLPLPEVEGFQWDDYAGTGEAPKSIIFTADTFEGERLKLLQPVALQAVFVAGRVELVWRPDGDLYKPSIYVPADSRFEELPADGDLNVAKTRVAAAIRTRFGSSGSPAAAAPGHTISGASAGVLDVHAGDVPKIPPAAAAAPYKTPVPAPKKKKKPAAKSAAKNKPPAKKG